MGKKDLYQSDFYEDAERFTDIFNGVLFAGREVMKPEELEEADSVWISFLEAGEEKKVICDKVRKWKGKYVSIMVLENQSYVDYRMVLRTMKTEAIGYEKQQMEAYRRRKKEGSRFDRHEYLSRMKKEEKFTPIITLVLYLGRDRVWDGARSLYELLEIEEELKPYINDYRLNLYDYHEYKDFSVFRTENRALFEALSCANDKKRMAEVLTKHQSVYSQLDEESIKAILGIMGERIELSRIKETTEKGEVYNMCKAFEDYKEEGREEGRREGEREGRKKGEIEALQRSLENMMKNLNISLERAMKLLEIPVEYQEKLRSLI